MIFVFTEAMQKHFSPHLKNVLTRLKSLHSCMLVKQLEVLEWCVYKGYLAK